MGVVWTGDFWGAADRTLGNGPLDILRKSIEEVLDFDDILGGGKDDTQTIISVDSEVSEIDRDG